MSEISVYLSANFVSIQSHRRFEYLFGENEYTYIYIYIPLYLCRAKNAEDSIVLYYATTEILLYRISQYTGIYRGIKENFGQVNK